MKQFPVLDASVIEQLSSIVGPSNVLLREDAREPYSHDETAGLKFMPAVVLKPADTAQISAVMKVAQSARIPVTTRGAGTGLSGGALPVYGGIVLSTERLNKIIEIDPENMMVVCQPAVITGELQKAVEEKGLFYPPDPASLESCSIGGNVAENAGGPRAFKYGVTREYVCGLEVVWPDGRISRIGGKLIKNVAGYDMIGMLCGSEGTLGIITEMTLSLLPKPSVEADLLIPFPSIKQAADAFTAILNARILPATMEFMEKRALLASEKLLGKEAPCRNAEAHLLIQLDGSHKSQVEADYEKIGEIASEFGAEDVLVAEDKTSKDRLWEMRRALAEALTHKSPMLIKEDVVVPRAKIPALLEKMVELEKETGVEVISFGHIGDGNVHVNLLKNAMSQEEWDSKSKAALEQVFKHVIAFGGTITGEHGVGCRKSKYLGLVLDDALLGHMKELKDAIDPEGILNPGKIFLQA